MSFLLCHRPFRQLRLRLSLQSPVQSFDDDAALLLLAPSRSLPSVTAAFTGALRPALLLLQSSILLLLPALLRLFPLLLWLHLLMVHWLLCLFCGLLLLLPL